jgi:leader peptidase (prepilin peptidase)/N-methyltransferase
MTTSGTFRLDYRPSTYWETPSSAIANIKGEARREAIRDLLECGALADGDPRLMADALSEDQRLHAGSFHPSLMGGEYLPDYVPGEVEIARIALKSTTADVISIRARREGSEIQYRIVDEYDTRFECTPATSASPLTMGELISFIDTAQDGMMGAAGLTSSYRQHNLTDEADPTSLIDFVTVSSPFYPELQAHFPQEAEEWVAQRRATLNEAADPRRGEPPKRGTSPMEWAAVTASLLAAVVLLTSIGRSWGEVVVGVVLLGSLLVATVLNHRTGLIPDVLTLPGMAIAITLNAFVNSRLTDGMVGALVGGGVFFALILSTRGGIGGGVMKMGAMVGAFLGWQLTLVAIVLSFILSAPVAIPLLVGRRREEVQFAPFLAGGSVLSLVLGESMLRWYLRTFS